MDMSRVEFVERLVELTEGDYPVALPIPDGFYPADHAKEYSREVYDNSFRLWKTKDNSRYAFIFHTITYVRLIDEADDTVSIRYLIRFSTWIIMGGLFITGAMFYGGISGDIVLLYGFMYVLYLLLFNSMASDDKAFLRKLTNQIDIGN